MSEQYTRTRASAAYVASQVRPRGFDSGHNSKTPWKLSLSTAISQRYWQTGPGFWNPDGHLHWFKLSASQFRLSRFHIGLSVIDFITLGLNAESAIADDWTQFVDSRWLHKFVNPKLTNCERYFQLDNEFSIADVSMWRLKLARQIDPAHLDLCGKITTHCDKQKLRLALRPFVWQKCKTL